jgi:hypothetical protein
MHNEIRYQAKTHAISEKAIKRKKKILHLLPNFLFIFFMLKTIKQKNNKDMRMEKEITSCPQGERFRNTETEKQPPNVLLTVIPKNKYLQKILKITREKIWG